MYIGKAKSLRKRLIDHARGQWWVSERLAGMAQEVRWVETVDEREALCREADLIVGLGPTFNAAMSGDTFTFVRTDPNGDAVRFRLIDQPAHGRGTYGAFPHLGKGKASWCAVRTNAGYSALLRLAWVAFADAGKRHRIPARLRGTSPPADHSAPFAPDASGMLHDFMAGRSSRLLARLRDDLMADEVEFMRGPLAEDLMAAEGFYRLGPHALRALRLRGRLPVGPVAVDTFRKLQYDELQREIGPFEIGAASRRGTRMSSRLKLAGK